MSRHSSVSATIIVRWRLDANDGDDRSESGAVFEGAAPFERTTRACLTVADVLCALPAGSDPGGCDASTRGRPLELPLPAVFCRSLDGWVFLATPDAVAWRSLCMTFLNRDVAQRFDCTTAWRSREALDLAGLALGTYACDDLEGRCATFGVPCITVADGHRPTASSLRYGVIAAEPRGPILNAEEL